MSVSSKSLGPDSDLWLRGDQPSFGGPILSNAFEQVVWVYRAITVLAEQIGNIPFLFSSGERGRENLITHGPLADFYDQPHPQINRFEYWELRIIWLMLRGECFRIPIYDSANPVNSVNSINSRRKLSRILIPDPARFQQIIENHQLLGWRYTGFGPHTPLASQVFLPEEVWFEKLPNPFNFWRGLAPLQVAALAAQTDFAAGSFMKGVLENNADLGLIVKTKDQMGPDQWEQLKAALRDRKRRAGTADGPLLLWNTAEVVQPRLSSGDLQFLENRKFSRAEICAAFGVPEEIVTTTDHSKYDVMDGARLNFIEHRVAPLCRRLEASEKATVKSLDPNAIGWFDLDSLPILQKAQRDRLATARSVFEMGVPFNELNRVLDLGFRKLPWGNRGYVAARLVEVGEEEGPKAKIQSLSENVQHSTPARKEHGVVNASATRAHQEPLERMSGLLKETQNSKVKTPESEGSPEPAVHGPQSGESVPVPIYFLSAEAALKSRLRRFFFEQRGRLLSIVGEPSAAGETSALLFAREMERIQILKLPSELDDAQAAALREKVKLETQTVCEAISNSLADSLRNNESSEQRAERVRAIYNRNVDEAIERVVPDHQI